jgi:taurine---2-oxoglutarate transaminase
VTSQKEPVLNVAATDEIVARCRKYTLYEWSSQNAVDPMPVVRAKGVYMWDSAGKRYLDFNSQSVYMNIGHGDERVAQAVAEQMKTLSSVSPFQASEIRGLLGEALAAVTPPGLTKAFLTLGGSDANEAAMRIARLVTGKHKIVTRYRSYHGSTQGTLFASGDPRRWANETGMGGIVRVPDPYRYRCSWCSRLDGCTMQCLGAIEEVVELEGPTTIAAVMVEPITGTNGIIVPPAGWLAGLRKLCDKYGLLLIADEVMSGFGRTGRWFAVNHEQVVPDIMTVGKGITSGYVPLGACIVSDRVADHFNTNTLWAGLTYNSHPVGCAAALANLKIYQSDQLVDNSQRMGNVLLDSLVSLKSRHPSVGDVRGQGLFAVIELVRDHDTRQPLFAFPGPPSAVLRSMQTKMRERGVVAATRGSLIYACPPLCINKQELDEGLSAIDAALDLADEIVA